MYLSVYYISVVEWLGVFQSFVCVSESFGVFLTVSECCGVFWSVEE